VDAARTFRAGFFGQQRGFEVQALRSYLLARQKSWLSFTTMPLQVSILPPEQK